MDNTDGLSHEDLLGVFPFRFLPSIPTRIFFNSHFMLQLFMTEVLIGIRDWVSFYEKDYKLVGVLVGRYYDSNGMPTAELKDVCHSCLTSVWTVFFFDPKRFFFELFS